MTNDGTTTTSPRKEEESKEPESKEPDEAVQHTTRSSDEEEDEKIIESLYGSLNSLPSNDTSNRRRTSVLRTRGSLAYGDTIDRKDHLQSLMMQKRASVVYVKAAMRDEPSRLATSPSMQQVLSPSKCDVLDQDAKDLREAAQLMKDIKKYFPDTDTGVSVRLTNFTYKCPVNLEEENKIETVYNQSIIYDVYSFFLRLIGRKAKPQTTTQVVLNDITLNFEPGKMYLILGPPASGKSSLLKAVAGRLSTVHGETIQGSVQYNGLSLFPEEKQTFYVENVISFVGQLDFHAPRLTVKETFDFAFQCKSGGTHIPKQLVVTKDAKEFVEKLDQADAMPMVRNGPARH